MSGRVLNIGIGSKAEFLSGTGNPEDAPSFWFDSLADFARLMSGKNMQLLQLIREESPGSMLELAQKTGRNMTGLADTLKQMEEAGIIRLVSAGGRRVRPEMACDDIRLILSLSSQAAGTERDV